jgi:predicted amino acid-binding ACT domain protein
MSTSGSRRPFWPAGSCRPGDEPIRQVCPSTSRVSRAGALLTITGPHRPEVVEQLFVALAAHDGSACEPTGVGQVILRGRLMLVVAVRLLRGDRGQADPLLARLVRLAADLSRTTGMAVAVTAADSPAGLPPDRSRTRVTILGRPVPLDAVAASIEGVRVAGGRVEAMSSTSSDPLTGVELLAYGARPAVLCSQLAWVAASTGTDIAVA